MSRIFEYLKEKANNPKDQNRLLVYQNNFLDHDYYSNFTCKELYDAVCNCINFLRNNITIKDKICFLVVKGEAEDIITFISLLELGIKPITINLSYLRDLHKYSPAKKNNKFVYDILQSVDIDGKNITMSDDFDLDTEGQYNSPLIITKEEVNEYLINNIDFNTINEEKNFDFAILTSGTTGKSKIFTIDENELIKTIFKKYDLHKEENYISPMPISAISGILFSLYVPIIGNNKTTNLGYISLNREYDKKDHFNIILSANYQSKINPINYQIYFLLSDESEKKCRIDQITFLGDKLSYNAIKALRMYNDLSDGTIVSYYGRTENLGLVSKVNERDLKVAYIYYFDMRPDKIIYTYDKKIIYEDTIVDGKRVTKRIEHKFNKEIFDEVLPVAILNNPNEDVKIDEAIFGRIIAEGKKTDDFGFILDNKIYYMARENELVKLEDNRYYSVSALEKNLLPKFLNNPDFPNANCYCVPNENNHINIYIPAYFNEYRPDNYRNYRAILNHFLEFTKDLEVKVDNIILFNKHMVPVGCEVGKLKRNSLLTFDTGASLYNFNNGNGFVRLIEGILSKEFNRKITLTTKYDYFIFPKEVFSVNEIARVLKMIPVLDYREDDNNYYLVISDEFLLARWESEKKEVDKTTTKEYQDLITNHKLRRYLADKNGFLNEVQLEYSLYYDENKDCLTVIYRPENIMFSLNDKMIKFTYNKKNHLIETFRTSFITTSYDSHSIDNYYYRKFSIDRDGNFYVDDNISIVESLSSDITQYMYKYLIEHMAYFDTKKIVKKL